MLLIRYPDRFLHATTVLSRQSQAARYHILIVDISIARRKKTLALSAQNLGVLYDKQNGIIGAVADTPFWMPYSTVA